MDMFKGQGSDDLREFWAKNDCEIVIIPHNLFSRFEPLDLSVNKAAKAYVSEMYNTWMVNEISKQLKEDIAPADVKVSLVLFVIKTLHVKRIVDLYHHKKADKQIIVLEQLENLRLLRKTSISRRKWKILSTNFSFFNIIFLKAKTEKVKVFVQKISTFSKKQNRVGNKNLQKFLVVLKDSVENH